ncbi:MAG: hypothetical protein AAFZ74_10300 [Pseudomonadota bacterium]
MKLLVVSLLSSVVVTFAAVAAETPPLEASDLEIAIGADWTGSLTYLNYQDPFVDFTIPAALEVEATETGLQLAYKYPDEPHANSTIVAEISQNGTLLMGEPIVSNLTLEDGGREVKTAFDCEDMGRPAACEMTYSFSANELRIKKMVTFEGETEGFRRNEYVFTR